MRPALPSPRGLLSEELIVSLRGGPAIAEPLSRGSGGVFGEDHQLALYVLYELHYRGFQDVDDRLEWDPSLLRLRAALEADFEARLREEIPSLEQPIDPKRIGSLVTELIAADDGPELSIYMERKAALVEVQADEYGGGRSDRVHATLFARAMRALDLDPTYGAYLDRIPATTLATVNLMSMCGLNRRLRGAIVGHLAAFETTSPVPNARYARGLRRLGLGDDALDFFEEHVEADSVHENIALYDMAQALAVSEPALADDVLFGVRALLRLDARFAARLLECWEGGAGSLLDPLAVAP